jgi:hypothetical protein
MKCKIINLQDKIKKDDEISKMTWKPQPRDHMDPSNLYHMSDFVSMYNQSLRMEELSLLDIYLSYYLEQKDSLGGVNLKDIHKIYRRISSPELYASLWEAMNGNDTKNALRNLSYLLTLPYLEQ